MGRAIVTGATGFVGANLVRYLLAKGETVHVPVRQSSNLWRLADIRDRIHLHTVDLLDQSAVAAWVKNVRPDVIYHLAAYGAYSYQRDYARILQTNLMGTAHLVEAASQTGFTAFVNAGSSSEYGFKDHAPPEDELPEPNSYYAVAKVSATLYCQHVSHTIQRPITTLRLYSVYGAYEEPSRLMPTLIKYGLAGTLPPLVSPDTARDFVYIDEVCEAFWRVAQQDMPLGAVLNVGTGQQQTLRDVVNVARQVLDIAQEPDWGSMDGRDWDTQVWVADVTRLRQTLGWQPTVAFPQGFATMVDWFKEHQHFYG